MLKTTLLNAVEAGAKQLRRYFNNEDLKISDKEGINNWVTEADLAAEKAIIDVIKADYPDHFILSEEVGEMATGSDTKWIIDPIDGTINFASGIPICCVNSAQYHLTIILYANAYTTNRNTIGKIDGAVNGINDPFGIAACCHFANFLT